MTRTTPSTTRSSSPTTTSNQAAAVRAHVPGRPQQTFPRVLRVAGARRGPQNALHEPGSRRGSGPTPPQCRADARVGGRDRLRTRRSAHTERSPAVPGTRKHQLTDEERAERRRADREYARQAVEQLRGSGGWQRWLATRRHFHAYSFGNQVLIAMGRPTATRVAGFRAWLKLGYAVQHGERSIKVGRPARPAASNSSAGSKTAAIRTSAREPTSAWRRCSPKTRSRRSRRPPSQLRLSFRSTTSPATS